MATTQVQKRGFGLIAAVVAAFLAAVEARAGGNWMPLLPDQDFYDFQIFAPPDLDEYNIYAKRTEGFFFNYDRLFWAITPPKNAVVGNQNFWPIEILSPTAFPDIFYTGTNAAGEPQFDIRPVRVFEYGTGPSNFEIDTSWLMTEMTWGNRYEGGWIYDDAGVYISGYMLQPQVQALETANAFAINTPNITPQELTITQTENIVNPNTGEIVVVENQLTYAYYQIQNGPPDHLIEQTFTTSNSTTVGSIEVDFLKRIQWSRRSPATLDMTLGARFFQLADRFNIDYTSQTTTFPTPTQRQVLQQANWNTLTTNNIVGPQFGLRNTSRQGRWTLALDLKMTPGFNFANTVQRGSRLPTTAAMDYFRGNVTINTPASQFPPEVGPGQTPPDYVNFPPVGVIAVQNFGTNNQNQKTESNHTAVFSPIGEWRLEAAYQVSRAIALRVGYSGMWLGGVSRASRKTVYETVAGVPGQPTYDQIGTTEGNAWDQVFVNGADFGFEFNY